jgi:hypothetical protein
MALNRLKNQLNRKNGKRGERKRMGSLNGGSVKIRGVTGFFLFFFFLLRSNPKRRRFGNNKIKNCGLPVLIYTNGGEAFFFNKKSISAKVNCLTKIQVKKLIEHLKELINSLMVHI